MDRRITGFHQDGEAHWVADLECGHSQHVRHEPPWQVRSWVIDATTRNARLGTTLPCPLCDLPASALTYDEALMCGLCEDGAREAATREKVLFVCSRNRARSLTAAELFRGHGFYDAQSAGTSKQARIRVTAGLIGWADRIFAMEKEHVVLLRQLFEAELRGKSVICLHIPDEYEPHAEDLVEILRARLLPHLDHLDRDV